MNELTNVSCICGKLFADVIEEENVFNKLLSSKICIRLHSCSLVGLYFFEGVLEKCKIVLNLNNKQSWSKLKLTSRKLPKAKVCYSTDKQKLSL